MVISNDFAIFSGNVPFSLPFVLRDEPAGKFQIDLEEYFAQTYEKLSARLEKFGDLSRISRFSEEKEILSLLQTLMETKDMIRTKKDAKNGMI
jgi:hypothetical protein